MHTFLVCAFTSQDFTQSQKNFARSHDLETVTFRNSASVYISAVQYTSVYMSAVQYTSVYISEVQYTSVYISEVQYTSLYMSAVQYTSVDSSWNVQYGEILF